MDWAILFDLQTFGMLIEDAELRQVFRLGPDCPLDRHSHVVLTPEGNLLAPRDGGPLELAASGRPQGLDGAGSLADSFRDRLEVLEWKDADCLGLARLDKGGAAAGVVLSVVVDARTGWGSATAVWDRDDDELDSLLAAVGVHREGGEQTPAGRVTRLRVHLPTHIRAGRLASFHRTGNCTRFFVREGVLDDGLRAGLALAGRDRVRDGHARALATVARLARSAQTDDWAMRFERVHPAPASHFGDVSPLGLPLRALRDGGDRESFQALLAPVQPEQREGLWPFHRGGLLTSIDTGLMALGVGPFPAAQALERFRTQAGAYVPQLCAESAQADRMQITEANRHWCQPDYGSTTLVAAVRREAGDPREQTLEFLAAGFDRRAGLYFPNPYLVDWVLAEAIGPTGPEHLRSALLAELVASMKPDHTFGHYDVACSTALGALALAALGYRGKTLRLVQLRLVDLLTDDGAMPADSVVFHQSLRLDPDRVGPARLTRLALDDPEGRIVSAHGSWFALSWFRDRSGLLAGSLAALALAVPCESAIGDLETVWPVADDRLARYRATTPSAYIGRFALPPYAG